MTLDIDVYSDMLLLIGALEREDMITPGKVDEERKETHLQGLKDRLAISDGPEADVLRQEVECLEQEIEELTEFSSASSFGADTESG